MFVRLKSAGLWVTWERFECAYWRLGYFETLTMIIQKCVLREERRWKTVDLKPQLDVWRSVWLGPRGTFWEHITTMRNTVQRRKDFQWRYYEAPKWLLQPNGRSIQHLFNAHEAANFGIVQYAWLCQGLNGELVGIESPDSNKHFRISWKFCGVANTLI